MQQILNRLQVVSKIVLILGAFVAGIWAIIQYEERKQDSRVAETLGYVQRFSSDRLVAAQERIALAWYAVRESVAALKSPQFSSEEYKQRKRQLVMMVVEKTPISDSTTSSGLGLVPDLDLLLNFFYELQVCDESNLCDTQTAESYFKSYAQQLYCDHEPYISWKKSSYSEGYGEGLRNFAHLTPDECNVSK